MGFEDSQTNSWNNHRPQKDDINLSLMKALLDAGLKTNVAHETRFFQRLFPADCNYVDKRFIDLKIFKLLIVINILKVRFDFLFFIKKS